MKQKNILTKAFAMLIVALFSLTDASAQTVVSDVTATQVGPTYATLSWTAGNATSLRYRVAGTQTTYNFDNSQLSPWITFSGYRSNNGLSKFVWDLNSTNQTYRSYQAGTGLGRNGSADMVISGSYCSNSGDTDYSNQGFTANSYLVSPQITLGGTISFWAKGMDPADCAEHFTVEVVTGTTTPTRKSTFTQVGSEIETTAEWTQYVFDLGNFSGQGYVAIHHCNCEDQDLLCVDDIVLTAPGGDWTTITIPSGTSYQLTDLTEETNYQVCVQAGGSWIGTNFSTTGQNPVPAEVAATTTTTTASISWFGLGDSYEVNYRKDAKDGPQYFFDDFEDGFTSKGWTAIKGRNGTSSNNFPNGWKESSNSDIENYKFTAHSGTQVARSLSWGGSSAVYRANNWLITPKVTFGKKLKFWIRTNPGYPDKYDVRIFPTNKTSVAASDTASFTVIKELAPAPAVDAWSRIDIDLSSYVDQDGYIAICHKDYDKNYLVIDDFGLFDDDVPGSGGWTTVTASNLSQTLESLIPNTTYEYTITSIKSGEDNATTNIFTFTTETLASLELADAGQNTDLIHSLAGASNIDVKLVGRTLVGGKWNTLCLPFTVTRISNSPLAGADVRQLTSASFDADNNKTLKLTFSSSVTKIEAGVPYIIKPSSDIEAPEFSGMQIREGLNPKKCEFGDNMSITFRGTYDKITDFVEQLPGVNSRNSVLFMNSNNNLVYPSATAYLNAQRALFMLSGIVAGPVGSSSNLIKAFVVNLDEEDPTAIAELLGLTEDNGAWYDLNGRKLAGKPAQKGIYINNGKKTIIK